MLSTLRGYGFRALVLKVLLILARIFVKPTASWLTCVSSVSGLGLGWSRACIISTILRWNAKFNLGAMLILLKTPQVIFARPMKILLGKSHVHRDRFT